MRLMAMTGMTLLAAAVLAFGQDAATRVHGVVLDPAGAPISGARVVLGDAEGNARLASTGKDGAFEIRRLAPGTYSLTVRAGLDTDTYDNESVVVEASHTTEQTVRLAPRSYTRLDSMTFELPVCFPGFRPSWPGTWPVPPPVLAPAK
jgi:hypothetical protein